MATPIQSRSSGSQNSDEPQVEQKPRRTFSEDWNQVTCSRRGSSRRPRHVGRREEVPGVLAALAAVAGVRPGQVALDLEPDGPAET